MPANTHLQVMAEEDDISVLRSEPGVLTLDSEVAGEVDDWLATLDSTAEDGVTITNNAVGDEIITVNNAVEDLKGSTNNAADNETVITTNSVEDGVTAIGDILEDDHKDEFLATPSSHNPEGSYDTAESEEEVEDEILESVNNFFT